MKKWAIGCGVALLIVVVILAAGGYYLYRKAAPFVASMQQMATISDLEKQVVNRSAYTAPASGELSDDQVARFLKVEEHIQAKLGDRSAQLKTKYDEMERVQKAENRQPSLAEAMVALKDLSSIIVDGKRAQVEALNQAGFSLDEYRWVRGQVYSAAGIALSEVDFAHIADTARAGGRDVELKKVGTEGNVPERNKELVKPHLAKLQEWIGLGFFGL